MIPNTHIHEHLMYERVQERLRASERRRLLATLRKPHHSLLHSLGDWLYARFLRSRRGTKLREEGGHYEMY